MQNRKGYDLHLVRHYPYHETPEFQEFESLVQKSAYGKNVSESEQARLDEIEKGLTYHTRFEALPNRIKESLERIFENGGNILLCYDPEGKNREIDTAKDLIRYFEIPEEHV
ncbi:MAG: hypothetical protein QG650_741 [Patescibacteria group bacterium]|nr:hypothetical protein [Patescibacteria group bacterium]